MHKIRNLLVVLPVILLAASAGGADSLVEGGVAVVREVVDGDTVLLDREVQGSGEVRLVGIQAPKLPLGRPGFAEWPLAPEAKAELERIALGKRVRLMFGGRRVDRHGRLLAHLFTDGGDWLQGEMLGRGFARLYTFPDNRAAVAEMRQRERQARERRLGIWALPFYAIRSPAGVRGDIGTFQLVAGVIADAAAVKGTIYLNFAPDWRSDFTVAIDKEGTRAFAAAGLDPRTWKGRRVLVRGWVSLRNGPMIEASHPEQIELDPPETPNGRERDPRPFGNAP